MTIPVYFFVEGTIVVIGKGPDGDSVRFVPRDEHKLDHIRRAHLLRPASDGSHQLRLEGIDAPETHFGKYAQPMGDAARDHFLKGILQFKSLTFHNETVTEATPPTLPAAILTQAADVHGRPISYLLLGDHAHNPFGHAASGEVTPELAKLTANCRMVADGLSYVMMYTSMPRAHQELFSAAAKKSRHANKKGTIWPLDRSLRFHLNSREDVEAGYQNADLIFPKLFRRAMDYFDAVEKKGFEGDLIDWLKANSSEDDQVLLGGRHPVPMSTLIHRENDRFRFDVDVNEAVFIEK
jgi:hypothetical protein